MTAAFGISLSFLALFAWGIGDFLIQRSTRYVGSVKTLFYIGAVGTVLLLPFVYETLLRLTFPEIGLLGFLGAASLVASAVDFEALRKGKISIVQPVISFELPLTIFVAVLFLGERFTFFQMFLMLVASGAIILVAMERLPSQLYPRVILEKGVRLAFIAAFLFALMNVLTGEASDSVSPYIAIWTVCFVKLVAAILYSAGTGGIRTLFSGLGAHPGTLIGQGILDLIAWVSFAVATTLIPIAIATTISSAYAAVSVLLGLVISHERIALHQKTGIALTLAAVVFLSYLTA